MKDFFNQPYAAIGFTILAIAAIIFQLDWVPTGEKAPFLFAVTVFMGAMSKGVVAMKSDAPNTALLLMTISLVLAIATAVATDISVFLDAVWEGIMVGLASSGVALLGEAQNRSNEKRGIEVS